MSDLSITQALCAALEFDVNNECGYWDIPIDDLDGDLDFENPKQIVGALEAEPIEKYFARTQALVLAMCEGVGALEHECGDVGHSTLDHVREELAKMKEKCR